MVHQRRTRRKSRKQRGGLCRIITDDDKKLTLVSDHADSQRTEWHNLKTHT